jgi:N-acetylmuramic acid 6-phosphate etherase
MSVEKRNPRSVGIDKMTSRDIVRLMNEEELGVWRALKQAEADISYAAERVADCYRFGGRVFMVGAGTGGRLAFNEASEMVPTFGVDPDRFVAVMAGGAEALTRAVEGAEDSDTDGIHQLNQLGLAPDDCVIGISASGRTPFVVSTVAWAKKMAAWTCGIYNQPHAPLGEVVDHRILLNTGPEVITGSTRLKAGTAQKLALNRISTTAMILCGRVIENLMVDVQPTNSKLRDRCVRILRELTSLPDDQCRSLLERHNFNVRQALSEAWKLEEPAPPVA